MDQKNRYSTSLYFNSFLFVLIFLMVPCSCVDEYYELCKTQSCGTGPNIRYPFRIPANQSSYCGYPGFEVNCSSFGYPFLRLDDQDYVVEDVSYETSTIRLYNGAFSGPKSGCFPSIMNYSLEGTPFISSDDESYSDLHFLSDCNMSSNFERYKIGCGNGHSGLVMFGGDEKLEEALGECRMNVIALVENVGVDESNVKNEYEDLMKRGFELSWTISDCSVCTESGGRCGFNVSTYHFACFCTDRPHSASCPQSKSWAEEQRKRLVFWAAGGAIIILVIMVYFLWGKNLSHCRETRSNDYRNIEKFLKNYGSGSVPKRFKYYEIKRITSSFKHKLGQGGFGSVFKGYLADKNPVAVKLLSTSKGNGDEFINEVASISNTSHVNVVKLLGFCFEYNKRALVYEYMPNGSLEKYIFSGKATVDNQLGWSTLFKISVGIARGLEYLHLFCGTRMVHFDIKPHNILLDKDFCPKISDFGLAKLHPANKIMLSLTGARGTIGYIAPEVVCRNFGGVSHKSDVYSYGMMILEMVGGRKNSDFECNESSQVYFPHWIHAQLERDQEIVLPSILDDADKESARKMILVSLWCIQTDPSNRPTMSRAVEMLEGDLDILQIPPRPYLFSSANSCVADSSSFH